MAKLAMDQPQAVLTHPTARKKVHVTSYKKASPDRNKYSTLANLHRDVQLE